MYSLPTLAANGIVHLCVPGTAADASAYAAALTSCRRPHAMQEPTMTTLAGKTLFISGASRGIGLAIAVRAARDGANVALIAKTAEPHPKLEGTVYTAAAAIEAAGGRALPIVGDIRDDQSVADAVAATVEKFGGIDICINNATAINRSGTERMDI